DLDPAAAPRRSGPTAATAKSRRDRAQWRAGRTGTCCAPDRVGEVQSSSLPQPMPLADCGQRCLFGTLLAADCFGQEFVETARDYGAQLGEFGGSLQKGLPKKALQIFVRHRLAKAALHIFAALNSSHTIFCGCSFFGGISFLGAMLSGCL